MLIQQQELSTESILTLTIRGMLAAGMIKLVNHTG